MTTAALQPGSVIPLSADQREALGRQSRDLTLELERKHARRIADVGIWWDWYAAKPDVPVRTEPWHRASNVVVPFIRQQADSLSARHFLQVFSTPHMWSGTTENQFFRDRLQPILDFHNYSARRPFEMMDPVEAGIVEFIVIGKTIWGQRWHRRSRFLVPPGRRRPAEVVTGESVELYHRPIEQWLWMEDTPVAESPVVIEQSFLSESDLIRMSQVGRERARWDRQAIEDVLGETGIEGPVEEVRRKKLRQMGFDGSVLSQQLEPHDIRQLWIDWPFFSSLDRMRDVPRPTHILNQEVEDVSVPVCVTIHRRTGTLLRAIYSPYILDRWPFYEANYRKVKGPGNISHGVAKMGEHIQRAMSTIVNQSIDSITLANSIKLITSDKDFSRRGFMPNTIPHVTDVNAVKELTAQKPVFPDIAVMNALQAIGERTIGQGDPNLGREVRLGGHPQPATNFLGLIQQSQILNTRSMKSLRAALTRMGEDRSIMFQQFEKDDNEWIERIFDPKDAVPILEFLNSPQPAPGHMRFDVHGLSEFHNPDAERQKAVLVDQMTTNYFNMAAQWAEVMGNPRTNPLVKQILSQALLARGQSMKKFLENSDVDNIEDFIVNINQINQGNLNAVSQLGQALADNGAQLGLNPNNAPGAPPGDVRGGGLEALATGGR